MGSAAAKTQVEDNDEKSSSITNQPNPDDDPTPPRQNEGLLDVLAVDGGASAGAGANPNPPSASAETIAINTTAGDGDGGETTNNESRKRKDPQSSYAEDGGGGEVTTAAAAVVVEAAVAATTSVEDEVAMFDGAMTDGADMEVEVEAATQQGAMMHELTAADVATIAVAAATTTTTSDSNNTMVHQQVLSLAQQRKGAPPRTAWEVRMEQLKHYKAQHGNLLIPIRYKLNPSLGKFVHNTREQYKLFHKRTPAGYKKKCSLTAERLAQLEEIGFVWNTERTKKQNEDWEHRLKQLRHYKDEHGDCLVPHGYKDDPSFAEWIHRQRTTYAIHLKEGRTNPMIEDRMKKLEEMGFNFRVHVDKWTEHFEALKEYRKQHGNCMVPTHYNNNMKLGRWVHTQRHQRRLMLRGKKSSMTEERVKQLEDLGFSWEVRPALDRPRPSWQSRFNELKEFVQKHGHFRVITPEFHYRLHLWCHEQRKRLQHQQQQTATTEAAASSATAAAAANAADTSSSKSKPSPPVRRLNADQVQALAGIGFTKDVELVPLVVKVSLKRDGSAHSRKESEGISSHEADDEEDDDDEEMHEEDEDEEEDEHDTGHEGKKPIPPSKVTTMELSHKSQTDAVAEQTVEI